MADNIFEIETAASAHRACSADDCGILLTSFGCAYSSVDRRWICSVLERANIPDGRRYFLRRTYEEFLTNVEHACAVGGQFLIARGFRQGTLAAVSFFAMAFGPI